MIITRTPFRISFFGGGTDFPAWYKHNGGFVLSTTIDKYCYINCRYLPPFFSYKHRILYSKYEHVSEIDEIIHPSVRETFRFMNVTRGIEMHHDGDLPARAGLGSSSSFTVGLLHALYGLSGKIISKKRLAMEAIHIEQNMIKESVGSQDQVAAAFGGFNKITFQGDHHIEVTPLTISKVRLDLLQDHLMLFFTGTVRFATDIEKEKIDKLPGNKDILNGLSNLTGCAIDVLNDDGDLLDFGTLLSEAWALKKDLSDQVSNSQIDDIYKTAMKNGAIGGKILGAGGGGFILFFVEIDQRERLKAALNHLLYVPFRFENLGSQVVYYNEAEV